MEKTALVQGGARTQFRIQPDLKPGDAVYVRNYTLAGKEFIEGRAIIQKRVKQDRFLVHFDNDDSNDFYERFVMPEHRNDYVTIAKAEGQI